MRPHVRVARLRGLLGYEQGSMLQRALVSQRRANASPDTLLLLEHQPVFTLGRLQESAANVLAGIGFFLQNKTAHAWGIAVVRNLALC